MLKSMRIIFYTSILTVALATAAIYMFSTSSPDHKEQKEEIPDEWFLHQRSYPYQGINSKVYSQALEEVRELQTLEKRSDRAWQEVGPTNIGGRVTSIALHPQNQDVIYAGTAVGGVFKSWDKGQSWRPIFDDMARLSIGAIALAPSNPRVLYVGTGEANASGGSGAFFGDGIYKSEDSGRTWKNIGLKGSFHVGRIVIDPQDEKHVLVATTGPVYGGSEERGLYRTRDGGETWQQILFLNETTSCIDVAVNPWNPDIIYAAMWERVRQPWGREYGGQSSSIYRSRDGGETWQRLETGLPQANRDNRGRIGIALSHSEPNTLYASFTKDVVTNEFDGLFKSTDGGDSWSETSRFQLIGSYSTFGWYFGNVRVDPNNSDVAYVLAINLFKTTNGGRDWKVITNGMHVDQHALAIHPQNSDFLVAGNDGGIYISQDGGTNWEHCDDLPITQFYQCEVSQDEQAAYYGGAQDNGTLKMGDNNINGWIKILGGDGFHTLVDPTNSEIVYAEYQWGNFFRSLNGGASFQQKMDGIASSDRNNWNTPVVFDPSDSEVLYYGSQRLYRSASRASSWTPISEDLTKGEHESGTQKYGTITSIAVAPSNENIIYVGTDDGNVQMTNDLGETWRLVSDSLPNRYVTGLAVDRTDAYTAYVTFSGYRRMDYQPHILVTRDGGGNWFDISSNLPEVPINEVLLDYEHDGHIYVATDLGVWVTYNRGEHWELLGKDMPITVVSDLVLHEPSRSLVASTYGRSMFKYPLEEDENDLGNPTLEEDVTITLFNSYPNPITTDAMLDIEVEKTLVARLRGYDLKGQKVVERVLNLEAGANTIPVDLSHLQAGMYWFMIEHEGEVIARQSIAKY